MSPFSLCESEVAIETKYVHSEGRRSNVTGLSSGVKGKRLRRNTIVPPALSAAAFVPLNKAQPTLRIRSPSFHSFRPPFRESPSLRNIWPVLYSATVVQRTAQP